MDNENKVYDIGIIGAGPAGLTAAIYALRDNKRVVLFEANEIGGQIINSPSVRNIPGFTDISGVDFIENMKDQLYSIQKDSDLCDFDLIEKKVITTKTIYNYDSKKTKRIIVTEDGAQYNCHTIIFAMGSRNRKLGVPGEDDIGDKISFCSTCDAPFCSHKGVIVVGGGNTALQEALDIARYADHVCILQNLSHFTGEKSLIDKVNSNNKITTYFNVIITSFENSINNESVVIHTRRNPSNENEEQTVFLAERVFLAIGLEPQNECVGNNATVNKINGYIDSLDIGYYAAGDCIRRNHRQVVTSCSDGAEASMRACLFVNTFYSDENKG